MTERVITGADGRKYITTEPLLNQGSDYERGFIDGMQKQMQSSVDRAVNAMAQPAPVHPDSARIDWLTNNPLDALDIFGHVKGSDAVRRIRQEIDNAMLKKDGATHD